MISRRRGRGGNTGDPYRKKYLTFTALEDNIEFWFSGDNSNTVQYSIDDGKHWQTLDNTHYPVLNTGEKVIWRGETVGEIGMFNASGNFNISGNPLSLIYGDDFATVENPQIPEYAFKDLFYYNFVVDASNLVLDYPIADYGCNEMFIGSTLVHAPKIVGKDSIGSCGCQAMFAGCQSLVDAPELPAVELGTNGYTSMFTTCKALVKAPSVIPVNIINSYGCSYMFYGCSALTTAPELPATVVYNKGYQNMFYNCTSLTKAPSVLPAAGKNKVNNYAYSYMFYGCTSLVKAPEILLDRTPSYCCEHMFDGCSSLNYIKCTRTQSGNNCFNQWVNGVAATGLFTRGSSYTSWTTGNSGIPSGWQVVTV